jgi:hypothetical protein
VADAEPVAIWNFDYHEASRVENLMNLPKEAEGFVDMLQNM